MNGPARKPVESVGGGAAPVSRLIEQLRAIGIQHWSNVPNDTWEAWMDDRYSPYWVRVLIMCVRYSFGYANTEVQDGAALCTWHTGKLLRPLQQKDIAERLKIWPQHISRTIAWLENRGYIRSQGHKISVFARPVLKVPETEPEASEDTSDGYWRGLTAEGCKILKKVTAAGVAYIRKQSSNSKAVSVYSTQSEWVCAFLVQVIQGLQQELQTLTHTPIPFQEAQENHSLRKELTEAQQRIQELEAQLEKHYVPAEVEERAVYEYLSLFTKQLRKAPDRNLVRQVSTNLQGAPIDHLRQYTEQKVRAGFQIKTFGALIEFADDVGRAHQFTGEQLDSIEQLERQLWKATGDEQRAIAERIIGRDDCPPYLREQIEQAYPAAAVTQ